MRVTFDAVFREAASGIRAASERLLNLQRQASSGRRIQKPSDDPSSTAAAVGERADMATLDRYTRTADSAFARLTVVDSVLSDVLEKLTMARTAILSAQGSTAGAPQRQAAAHTLAGVREALFSDLNASFQGVYLFGGASADAPPYQKGTGGVILPYQGSTTEVFVDIDDTRQVAVAFDGEAIARGTSADDVFTILDNLIAAATAGDTDALRQGEIALAEVFERVSAAQTRVGAAMQTIDEQKLRLGQAKLALGSRLSTLEDANMVDVLTGMAHAEAAYRAALGAASRSVRVSLLDYLG
jgi:flagellar hook-associated protein 3 FlgL